MNRNFKQSFLQVFTTNLKAVWVIYAVYLALIVWASVAAGAGRSSIGGYAVILIGFYFIVGVAEPREDLRLLVQNGVARRTAFTALAAAEGAAVLLSAVVLEAVTAVAGLLVPDSLAVMDLYQMFFAWGAPLSLSGHLLSALFTALLCAAFFFLGTFLALLFWRLEKGWMNVAAALVLAAAVKLIVDGSLLLTTRVPGFAALMSAPGSWLVLFLAVALLFAVLGWLLLRSCHIRGRKG